jgi:hypothetical protein
VKTKEETMIKRNPRSKRAVSARLLRTPLLVALAAPALLAPAAAMSVQARNSNTELDDVHGGAQFLSGSLTAGERAAPSFASPRMNGFIMKDTVIIPRRPLG